MRLIQLCVLAAACGSSGGGGHGGDGGGGSDGSGSNTGPGSVAGQVPGGNLDVRDAISTSITMTDDTGGSTSDARIMMATTPDLCSDAGAAPPIDRKQQRYVTIALRDVAGAVKTTPTAPGTYTIYPNSGSEPAKSASLIVGAFDGTCQSNDADSGSGQSGSVTLASINGGAFSGTFDVVLNTGGHITGSFHPAACTQLQAAVTNQSHSCK